MTAHAKPAAENPPPPDLSAAMPLGLLAVRLLALARAVGPRGLVHVAGSERRAEHLGSILRSLDPDFEAMVFPPWDCLPYDRASPSREAMGRRVACLRRLAEHGDTPRLVITTPD